MPKRQRVIKNLGLIFIASYSVYLTVENFRLRVAMFEAAERVNQVADQLIFNQIIDENF